MLVILLNWGSCHLGRAWVSPTWYYKDMRVARRPRSYCVLSRYKWRLLRVQSWLPKATCGLHSDFNVRLYTHNGAKYRWWLEVRAVASFPGPPCFYLQYAFHLQWLSSNGLKMVMVKKIPWDWFKSPFPWVSHGKSMHGTPMGMF